MWGMLDELIDGWMDGWMMMDGRVEQFPTTLVG